MKSNKMDNITNSLNEGKPASSEEETTNITTPKDFSNQKAAHRGMPRHTIPSYQTNTSFKERLESAKQHLQKIEKKKDIIDQRQVMCNVQTY